MSPEKQVTQEQYDQFDNRMLEQVETNITEKAQEMEKTLNQKIKETKARNEQLAQKISLFSNRLAELEQLLEEERERYQSISFRFDDFRLHMEHVVSEKAQAINERDKQLEEYRRQIENFIQEREESQKKIAVLRQKGERYDHIKKGLDQIRIQAELKAGKIVEEAQECAREAMDQVEDTVIQIQSIKEASEKGQTQENRLEQFYALLDAAVEKITGLREQFFIKNKIPMESAVGQYISAKTPLDRMLNVMLGGNENGTENISGGRSDGEGGLTEGGSADSF